MSATVGMAGFGPQECQVAQHGIKLGLRRPVAYVPQPTSGSSSYVGIFIASELLCDAASHFFRNRAAMLMGMYFTVDI
jgi:hypothetical protein